MRAHPWPRAAAAGGGRAAPSAAPRGQTLGRGRGLCAHPARARIPARPGRPTLPLGAAAQPAKHPGTEAGLCCCSFFFFFSSSPPLPPQVLSLLIDLVDFPPAGGPAARQRSRLSRPAGTWSPGWGSVAGARPGSRDPCPGLPPGRPPPPAPAHPPRAAVAV